MNRLVAAQPRIYVNGAYIPKWSVAGRVSAHEPWRVGNLLLTEEALELTTKSERVRIPIPSVTAVTPPTTSLRPPAATFEQALAVHHVEGGQACVTMIAFPGVTLRNFPLQLAGVLTGTIPAFVPKLGAGGATTYEEARFGFYYDHLEVRRRAGVLNLPLLSVASLLPARRRDANGREFIEWTIDHVQDKQVTQITLISSERMQFLWPLLTCIQTMRKGGGLGVEPKASDALPEIAQQVAVLLYTGGMGTAAIEQTLGIGPDQLDAIYEDLLKQGLAEVVKTRKEIALNAQGAKLVDEIMKKQIEISS